MKKLMTLLAAICLIPSLAFGANTLAQCKKLSDDEYRAILVSQPYSETFQDEGLTYHLVTYFHQGGTYDASITSSTPYGPIEMDFNGTWKVQDAQLTIHISDASHKPVQNKQLNAALDDAVAQLKSTPDVTVPLSDCSENTRMLNMNRSRLLKL